MTHTERNPKQTRMDDVFFDASELTVKPAYVSFVDIMGMATAMEWSLQKGANFMGRFHAILLGLKESAHGCRMYPVMDGAYIIASQYDDLLKFIKALFTRVGKVFVKADVCESFLIRGSIAYGEIVSGMDITPAVNRELAADKDYKSSLLMGIAVARAFQCVSKAPPFGIYIDNSIRATHTTRISGIWYQWCRQADLTNEMKNKIAKYFNWARDCSELLMYDDEKIAKHFKLAMQYWGVKTGGKKGSSMSESESVEVLP